MRKVVIMVLLSVLAVCSNVSAASDETPVKPVVAPINVTVNGELFCFGELQPIIKYGRMLVPLKSDLFEKFSATTEYDHIYKEIVIRTHTHILAKKPLKKTHIDKNYKPLATYISENT